MKHLGKDNFDLELTLANKGEVFLLFTNSSLKNLDAPTINGKTIGDNVSDGFAPLAVAAPGPGRQVPAYITALNNLPPSRHPKQAQRQPATPSRPLFASVGDSQVFRAGAAVTATLIETRTVNGITLNIWVEDDSYTGCNLTYCMNSTMVTAYADKFLSNSGESDIYNLVTNVFGVPWGSHQDSDLIAASYASQIDILFYDIGSDDEVGSLLGYYWSKDNYVTSAESNSNERLMFYIDSVYSAAHEGSSWEITDKWPQEMVGTLAHEFQHMIYFYQKLIQQNPVDDTTQLNEMLSMATEDMVARELELDGPYIYLGYLIDSAGESLTKWDSGYGYGLSLSFGGYLMRNFGGPELLAEMQHVKQGDYGAMIKAVTQLGYVHQDGTHYDMDDLLSGWAAANLLSSFTDAPKGYRLNKGKDFVFSYNGVSYTLPSLNRFSQQHMRTYRPQGVNALTTSSPMSCRVVRLGELAKGSHRIRIDKPDALSVTLVVR